MAKEGMQGLLSVDRGRDRARFDQQEVLQGFKLGVNIHGRHMILR